MSNGQGPEKKGEDNDVTFLGKDFEQCFEQMRHYDSQIIDLGKFAFTAYPTIVGAAVAIYKYGLANKTDYSVVAGMIPLVAFFPGLFLLWHMVRTRICFAQVTRYINEVRRSYLVGQPMKVTNESGMYADPKVPPYMDRGSSQLSFMYIMTILNSFLGGVAVYLLTVRYERQASAVALAFGALLVIQLYLVVSHLRGWQKRSSSASVPAHV